MENRNGHHVLLQFQSRICQLFSYFSCLFHAISSFMIKSPDVNLAVTADLPMHFGSMMSMESVHSWHVFTDFKGMKPVTCEACITCNAVTLIPPSTSPNDIFMLPEETKKTFVIDCCYFLVCDLCWSPITIHNNSCVVSPTMEITLVITSDTLLHMCNILSHLLRLRLAIDWKQTQINSQ